MSEPGLPESDHYGRATARLIEAVYAEGADRAVVLMRHSARTFDRSIHDLENPLTDHGRGLSRQFGALLPKDVHLRGYASPPARCMETAEITLHAHAEHGGSGGRVRPVEALGMFYALDQQKFWKGMMAADGMPAYIAAWFDDAVPPDAMMPVELAVQMILRVLAAKLRAPGAARQLDVCVSHDFTVYTVRHALGLEGLGGPAVEFLDGLVLFERGGGLVMRSQHGAEVSVVLDNFKG